jgi:hypothetical protein
MFNACALEKNAGFGRDLRKVETDFRGRFDKAPGPRAKRNAEKTFAAFGMRLEDSPMDFKGR